MSIIVYDDQSTKSEISVRISVYSTSSNSIRAAVPLISGLRLISPSPGSCSDRA